MVGLALVLGLVFGLRQSGSEEQSYPPPHVQGDVSYDDDYYKDYPASIPTSMPVDFVEVIVPTEAPKTPQELCESVQCLFSYDELLQALESDTAVIALTRIQSS